MPYPDAATARINPEQAPELARRLESLVKQRDRLMAATSRLTSIAKAYFGAEPPTPDGERPKVAGECFSERLIGLTDDISDVLSDLERAVKRFECGWS
jgi:hypothetical protein